MLTLVLPQGPVWQRSPGRREIHKSCEGVRLSPSGVSMGSTTSSSGTWPVTGQRPSSKCSRQHSGCPPSPHSRQRWWPLSPSKTHQSHSATLLGGAGARGCWLLSSVPAEFFKVRGGYLAKREEFSKVRGGYLAKRGGDLSGAGAVFFRSLVLRRAAFPSVTSPGSPSATPCCSLAGLVGGWPVAGQHMCASMWA